MKRTITLMFLIWIPFISIFGFASPALADEIGDSYPHMAFHVFAPVLLITALVLVRRLRREAPTRSQRIALRILLVTLPVAIVGNVLELIAAVRRFVDDGWESLKTPEIFNEPGLHTVGANLTIPGLMLSMVVVLVLAIMIAVQRRRTLESVA